jgi:hypothetical protein
LLRLKVIHRQVLGLVVNVLKKSIALQKKINYISSIILHALFKRITQRAKAKKAKGEVLF